MGLSFLWSTTSSGWKTTMSILYQSKVLVLFWNYQWLTNSWLLRPHRIFLMHTAIVVSGFCFLMWAFVFWQCEVCNITLGNLKAGDSLWIYKRMVHCSNCFEVTKGKQLLGFLHFPECKAPVTKYLYRMYYSICFNFKMS